MGYHTTFEGGFYFNKPIYRDLKAYINEFCSTRRMRRDPEIIKTLYPDWRSHCFNGFLGFEGEYFTKTTIRDTSVIDFNIPPVTQPGLWCDWIIKDDQLVWNGAEKFYNYTEWLKYLIKNFFSPLGYILDGDVEFQGEDSEDYGVIHVSNNNVQIINHSRLSELSETYRFNEKEFEKISEGDPCI